MHIYEKDGNKYPSVTTILKLISTDEKLLNWANLMGLKKRSIVSIQSAAMSFGTKVHSHLQYEVDPDNCNKPEEDKDKLIQYDIEKSIFHFKQLFHDTTFKTIFTEKTLYSDEYMYAGTLDWFAKINGKYVLADFKTSRKPYDYYKLQLGGYDGLLDEFYSKPIVDIGAIIICNANTASIHPISWETLDKCRGAFLKLNDFYHKYQDILNEKYEYELLDEENNNGLYKTSMGKEK